MYFYFDFILDVNFMGDEVFSKTGASILFKLNTLETSRITFVFYLLYFSTKMSFDFCRIKMV